MILLEFRIDENFRAARRLLEASGLPIQLEAPPEPWRPSLLWLFEEQLVDEVQRRALVQARNLEKLDRFQQRQFATLNLAIPQ